MDIATSSDYQGVNSDYTFTLQATESLPPSGEIHMFFPAEFGINIPDAADDYEIDHLYGSWTLA